MASSSKRVKLGFVPLLDSAPLILGVEMGFFREEGVEVTLVREPGWASIRDKLAYGEIDGAQALAGLGFALSWGLGVLRRPCLTACLLSGRGDSITVSVRLAEQGVDGASSLARWIRQGGGRRRPVFAAPHPFSAHHFCLRQWLKPEGLLLGRDYEMVILPPAHMLACLHSGYVDGFVAGEPYHTEAAEAGAGVILASSTALLGERAEKALLVSGDFLEQRPDDHRALVLGLLRACAFCESDRGRRAMVEILARPPYLNRPAAVLERCLAREDGSLEFHGEHVNRPSRDKANWLVHQMRMAGLVEQPSRTMQPALQEIFREDLYDVLVNGEKAPGTGRL